MRDSYIRQLRNVEVIDGDTVRATIRLGFGVELAYQSIRLYGVNAYETTRRGSWDNDLTPSEVEQKLDLGRCAKKILEQKIEESLYVGFESIISPKDISRKGKYGRWLGRLTIYTPDEYIIWNKYLVEKGYGYRKDYD
jgi:endonuclease YncB( thermonuclease family)